MKKSSYETIYSALVAFNYSNTDILEELQKEINRGAEAKAKKANEYDVAKAVIFSALASTDEPMTIAQLFEACKNELPEGFTKARVQYGITHQWAENVVKTEGKVNSYSLRA